MAWKRYDNTLLYMQPFYKALHLLLAEPKRFAYFSVCQPLFRHLLDFLFMVLDVPVTSCHSENLLWFYYTIGGLFVYVCFYWFGSKQALPAILTALNYSSADMSKPLRSYGYCLSESLTADAVVRRYADNTTLAV